LYKAAEVIVVLINMADQKELVEAELLKQINNNDLGVQDSVEFAGAFGFDHKTVAGVIRSLTAAEMVTYKEFDSSRWVLTKEGAAYADKGSPEVQVFNAIPEGGVPLTTLKEQLGKDVADVGFKQAMQQKWAAIVKGPEPLVTKKVDSVIDTVKELLQQIQADKEVDKVAVEKLKKRKMCSLETQKVYQVTKGPKFALEKKKMETDLTSEMVLKGTWKDTEFKPYNFAAMGTAPTGGHLHPLLKVRKEFREIFFSMGFEEMPTNNFVESGFWNFDALFQPQQHPARDAHDTFFMTTPADTPPENFPQDYLERVKTTHEKGGYGSIGYNYDWKIAEASKNLMRTHTTAVSSRMLYKLAQEGFKPKKYFSIDRVFRNEAVDRTHLAEFHQIEGVICDKGLTLGDLIGVLHAFFKRLGIEKLRFKPAFNPYTEPSMEIFSYHPKLQKWVEIGNSGMFRPEMLEPMGLPPDVSVIAWGLSLERPTMILYDIGNIRDLFGHKVNLSIVKSNPICRLQLPSEVESEA